MAWLTGYTYRKQVTITGSIDGALSNYQMLLNVFYGSGASAGNDVYLNSNCQTDFDDIRFTKSDGETELDHWREEYVASTSAIFWIEFDSIPASPNTTTFYIYYGNVGVSSASNGANTFIAFDDFERGNDGDAIGGNWNITVGDADISTDHAYTGTRCGKILGHAATSGIYHSVATSDNIAIRMRIWKEDAVTNGPSMLQGDGTNIWQVYANTPEDIFTSDGDTGSNLTPDQWELLEICDFSWATPSHDVYLNGAKIKDDSGMAANIYWQNTFLIANYDTTVGNDAYIDNFIVRNWRANDPAWTSWGGAEVSVSSSVIIGTVATGSRTLAATRSSAVLIGNLVSAVKTAQWVPVSASVLIGTVTSAARVATFTRAASVIVGNLVSATKTVQWAPVSASVLVGVIATATRLSASIRSATVLIGNAVTATRRLVPTRTSIVYIGNVVTASRAVTYTIASSVAVGSLVTASGIRDTYVAASVIIGNLVTASGTWARRRAAIVLVGVLPSASRVAALTRSASVMVGGVVTASRALTYTRASSIIVGVVVSATRTVAFTRSAANLIGVVATASKTVAFIRSATNYIGVKATASRAFTTTRTASVVVGAVVTASRAKDTFTSASVAIGSLITATGVRVYAGYIRKLFMFNKQHRQLMLFSKQHRQLTLFGLPHRQLTIGGIE